jgi:hypothetical protein
MWSSFRPGELVVAPKFKDDKEIFLLSSISPFYPSDGAQMRDFKLYQLAWNGRKFCRREKTVTIKKFEGSKRLQDLQVVPLSQLSEEEQDNIKTTLIERGKKWKSMCLGKACEQNCCGPCRPLFGFQSQNIEGFDDIYGHVLEKQVS